MTASVASSFLRALHTLIQQRDSQPPPTLNDTMPRRSRRTRGPRGSSPSTSPAKSSEAGSHPAELVQLRQEYQVLCEQLDECKKELAEQAEELTLNAHCQEEVRRLSKALAEAQASVPEENNLQEHLQEQLQDALRELQAQQAELATAEKAVQDAQKERGELSDAATAASKLASAKLQQMSQEVRVWKKKAERIDDMVLQLRKSTVAQQELQQELDAATARVSAIQTQRMSVDAARRLAEHACSEHQLKLADLTKSAASLGAERDTLAAKIVTLTKDTASAGAERDTLAAAVVTLTKDNANLAAERDTLAEKILTLTKDNASLSKANNTLAANVTEVTQAASKVRHSLAERDAQLKVERATVTKLRADIAGLQSDVATSRKIATDVAALDSELTTLRQQAKKIDADHLAQHERLKAMSQARDTSRQDAATLRKEVAALKRQLQERHAFVSPTLLATETKRRQQLEAEVRRLSVVPTIPRMTSRVIQKYAATPLEPQTPPPSITTSKRTPNPAPAPAPARAPAPAPTPYSPTVSSPEAHPKAARPFGVQPTAHRGFQWDT